MSFISQDWVCPTCGTTENLLIKRADLLSHVRACDCGDNMVRSMSVSICSVSYPDGSTNRFSAAKEKRNLDRAIRKAKRTGDKESVSLMEAEKKVVIEASKQERQKINICKKEEEK